MPYELAVKRLTQRPETSTDSRGHYQRTPTITAHTPTTLLPAQPAGHTSRFLARCPDSASLSPPLRSSEQESAEVLGSVYHTLATPALLPGSSMGGAATTTGPVTPGGAGAAASGGTGSAPVSVSVSAVLGGGAESELDLSDAMFGRLDGKLRQMRELKVGAAKRCWQGG